MESLINLLGFSITTTLFISIAIVVLNITINVLFIRMCIDTHKMKENIEDLKNKIYDIDETQYNTYKLLKFTIEKKYDIQFIPDNEDNQ